MTLNTREGWSKPWTDLRGNEWLTSGPFTLVVDPDDVADGAEAPYTLYSGMEGQNAPQDGQKALLRFDTQDDACEVAELILSKWANPKGGSTLTSIVETAHWSGTERGK